jgi:hypothetical protein
MLIDELIEKAFSDGYEYALMEQKEFSGSIRRTKKVLKEATRLNKKMEKLYPNLDNFGGMPLPSSKFRERSSRIPNDLSLDFFRKPKLEKKLVNVNK